MPLPFTHDWKPLAGWTGRYRCACHSIIGYRGIVTPDVHTKQRDGVIFFYCCNAYLPETERGPDGSACCGKPAVQVRKKRYGTPLQRCAKHQE